MRLIKGFVFLLVIAISSFTTLSAFVVQLPDDFLRFAYDSNEPAKRIVTIIDMIEKCNKPHMYSDEILIASKNASHVLSVHLAIELNLAYDKTYRSIKEFEEKLVLYRDSVFYESRPDYLKKVHSSEIDNFESRIKSFHRDLSFIVQLRYIYCPHLSLND